MNVSSTTLLEANNVRGSIPVMGVAKWALTEYMEQHDITPYRLAKVVEQHASTATVYGLVRKGGDVSRVDLGTLAFVLDGLRELTGQNVQVADLIKYTPDN